MKIKIKFKNKDWIYDLQEAAMNTIGKKFEDGKKMTPTLFQKYLISEHSPIRAVNLRIILYNISAYTSVHFARHVHSIPFVTSNRPDRKNQKRSVNDTVDHIFDINCQGLIDMMRKRLCKGQCAPDTYQTALQIKKTLMSSNDPYLQVLGKVLVPNGVYRRFCPEFKSCNYCTSKITEFSAYQNYNNFILREE